MPHDIQISRPRIALWEDENRKQTIAVGQGKPRIIYLCGLYTWHNIYLVETDKKEITGSVCDYLSACTTNVISMYSWLTMYHILHFMLIVQWLIFSMTEFNVTSS